MAILKVAQLGHPVLREVARAVEPAELAAPEFQAFLDDGWVDVVRPHTPGPDVYTYWDYYRQRFERNRGLRIDFILASPGVAARVGHAFIDIEERAGQGASDHAPVIADIDPAVRLAQHRRSGGP